MTKRLVLGYTYKTNLNDENDIFPPTPRGCLVGLRG